jgi:hypothetical protein
MKTPTGWGPQHVLLTHIRSQTTEPNMVGFMARPVYGAMWAPVLVAEGPGLGLGRQDDAALAHARTVFESVPAAEVARRARE